MRVWKRVLACALAVMLILPSASVAAEEPTELPGSGQEQQEPGETQEDNLLDGDESKEDDPDGDESDGDAPDGDESKEDDPDGDESDKDASDGDAPDGDAPDGDVPDGDVPDGDTPDASTPPANAALGATEEPEYDVIQFNTGDHVWSVADVEPDVFYSLEEPIGDVCFDEDGSYTINIPEANPFFPYEVQFTYNGEVTNEWFMSPDDSVEIGGHTFYVSAYFDGTALTQMSLKIGGDTVVVYPEEKEFTNDGSGVAPMSLIPLKHVELGTIDLSEYTPIELTQVGLDAIVSAGGTDVSESKKVAWKIAYMDWFYFADTTDTIDLSYGAAYGAAYGFSVDYEMFVGDGDQLNPDNIYYTFTVQSPDMSEWIVPSLYAEDTAGAREEVPIGVTRFAPNYYDITTGTLLLMGTEFSYDEIREKDIYAGLVLNNSNFEKTQVKEIEVTLGYGAIADSVATDITDQLLCTDMTQSKAGYLTSVGDSSSLSLDCTLTAYNENGEKIGSMPIHWTGYRVSWRLYARLYREDSSSPIYMDSSSIYESDEQINFEIDENYALNDSYTLVLELEDSVTGLTHQEITGVYEGQYSSIAEAETSTQNIMGQITGDGYTADYSQGVWFTVFVGDDGDTEQSVFNFCAQTQRPGLSSDSIITFTGLVDAAGNPISTYVLDSTHDSYAENNYVTFLVMDDVDLSKQYAPVFIKAKGAEAYTEGSTSPEVSEKSLHSFSNGAIQYSVSAENGINSKNYWVQIKQVNLNTGQLYISSLEDPDANTRVENGITYSTREMFLDSYHGNIHDICLVNIGTEALTNLSVELSSDVVELDEYWTLSGQQSLAGMSTVTKPANGSGIAGELPNLAKLRLRAKVGVSYGTEVSGTLTIKSDGKTIMVLTLTGTIGDPCITTTELPDAVKYVPYGTMIQNSNKYSWIEPVYSLIGGELPDGMEIKPNGELYGVPREAGIFTFTVMAEFGSNKEDSNFPSSRVTLTLNVQENTNANVYNASDTGAGYSLETPIGVEVTPGSYDFYLAEIVDSLFVSEGQYNEFIDLWLNGQKLVKGVDYTAESGSTRITISAQTLQNKAEQTGANTIAAEFRVGGDVNNELRRTAQNFRMDGATNSETGSSASGAGSSGGGGSNRSNVTGVTITGYLVDANNSPLVGMNVELHSTPRTTVTGTNGVFRFSDVEFGWHTLIVKDANGNTQASKRFELREDSVVTLSDNLITAPAGSGISFTVRLADGDLNFSNVRLLTAPPTGDAAAPEVWLFVLVMTGCAILAGAVIYRKKIKHS